MNHSVIQLTPNRQSKASPGWPVYQRRIQVHETDKDGVAHFSNYFKIGEEALFNGFRELGYLFEDSDYSLAMLQATSEYRQPVRFSDTVDVVLSRIEKQRIKLLVSLNFMAGQQLVARIDFKFVVVEIESRKAIPLPPSLIAIIDPLL